MTHGRDGGDAVLTAGLTGSPGLNVARDLWRTKQSMLEAYRVLNRCCA